MNSEVEMRTLNPYPAKTYPDKVNHLNFQPIEVVDRGSETQSQLVENYSY